MSAWTPAAVEGLINDIGLWVCGAMIVYAITQGLRMMVTDMITGEVGRGRVVERHASGLPLLDELEHPIDER